ncbi:hypothetical protein DYB32_000868 [Aphanomyces invadans]|uniref:glucan endo-1,3-beta-D-glucosidase n=1 Tax=Aphanomyces invadans TaxID=157072 RepID=A0A3R6YFX5_9STRA|nr:hypothetical protein DYB32_000868 [Aphanomyces invadans]
MGTWMSSPMEHKNTSPPDPTLFAATDALKAFISPTNVSLDKACGPVPTNKWWGNLLSCNAAGRLDPVYPSPYTVCIDNIAATIACSYLYDCMHQGPINVNGAISYYFFPRCCHLLFHCDAPGVRFFVEDWDDLTVQVALTDGKTQFLRSVMALGQAFMTIQHSNVPICLSSECAIVSVNGQLIAEGFVYKGRSDAGKLVLGLNNGQRWLLCWSSCASDALTFTFTNQTLKSSAAFNGIVQAAIVPSDEALTVLEQYAVHGFHYKWVIQPPTAKSALHFVLEHHKTLLTFHTQAVNLMVHSHTRGPMHAYTIEHGTSWNFAFSPDEEEKVAACAQFDPPRDPSVQDVIDNRVVDILRAEVDAATWVMPPGYYFRGKALQKYGSMCLLAAKLAQFKELEPLGIGSIASTALTKFKGLLDTLTTPSVEFPLVYDQGGNELSRIRNAVYNDHHYHYGYFIMAVAIAFHLDASYMHANTRLLEWTATLVRDVMSADDACFPRFRTFDWFLGHSMSHGVTCMVDGKDEESTSEEINCLYACGLWAQVTQNSSLRDVSRVMLKLASLAHRTYFFMSHSNVTHPPAFRPNKVSGILFENKCDYTTWFSANRECIHGIQMLPVSPVLEYSRPSFFVVEEWNEVLSKLDLPSTNAWTSLLVANSSVMSARDACKKLQDCAMDDGLSRAYALYFSLTRPSH